MFCGEPPVIASTAKGFVGVDIEPWTGTVATYIVDTGQPEDGVMVVTVILIVGIGVSLQPQWVVVMVVVSVARPVEQGTT